MMSEEDFKTRASEAERHAVSVAVDALREYNISVTKYLAELVASLCNTTVDAMMTESSRSSNHPMVYARWLYWYAYKRLTQDSCNEISLKTQHFGRRFSPTAISFGVSKIMLMISENKLWCKRWSILRRVIEEVNGCDLSQSTIRLKVVNPQGVNIEIEK